MPVTILIFAVVAIMHSQYFINCFQFFDRSHKTLIKFAVAHFVPPPCFVRFLFSVSFRLLKSKILQSKAQQGLRRLQMYTQLSVIGFG
jgi:hypothetical protein